ncbi:MAG: helix-turn-helix transcriptional regulator [Thermoguttaceae bacterium]
MNNKKLFGETLRRLRRAKEMTLAEVADTIRCSIVFISDVERGRRNPPSPEKIRKLLVKMGEENRLSEMLILAARSRQSIEISVKDKDDHVADMLVALARRCDEDSLDDEVVMRIKEILEQERNE